MPKFSKRSTDALKGVHPTLVKLMESAIVDSPVDFTVVEGLRTAATQRMYYSWGRTVKNPNTGALPGKPLGRTVTNRDGVNKKSEHQVKADGFGHAVDIYPYFNGSVQLNAPVKHRQLIAHIKQRAAKLGIKITCGIDWTSPHDPPHVELK